MEEKKTENEVNQTQTNKDEKEQDKNQAWVQERKSKRTKQPKVRKYQKRIEGKVQREAINEVEDILVRTAFSAIL
jgi:hypothetical protein